MFYFIENRVVIKPDDVTIFDGSWSRIRCVWKIEIKMNTEYSSKRWETTAITKGTGNEKNEMVRILNLLSLNHEKNYFRRKATWPSHRRGFEAPGIY